MAVPADDPRRYQAALILAGRYFKRPDAPFGIAGGTDVGLQQLRRTDPDVASLLVGLRSKDWTDQLGPQVWPDLATLKQSMSITTTADDALLQSALDAAVAVITGACSSTPAGVA